MHGLERRQARNSARNPPQSAWSRHVDERKRARAFTLLLTAHLKSGSFSTAFHTSVAMSYADIPAESRALIQAPFATNHFT